MTKVEEEINKGKELSIVNLVQYLIEYAHSFRASDIHIDPSEKEINIRFRIDGMLVSRFTFSKKIHEEIILRIKVLSAIRTDIHLSPLDGRFKVNIQNEFIDLRVSIMPTYYGESVVLRILSQSLNDSSLGLLGMSQANIEILTSSLIKPCGMILVTGPTGSGKTTTLYTILKILNTADRSLVTLEDPIEYSIKGVKQIQVHPDAGLTFSKGLRSILRQDPNIIMLGEIRDSETAQIIVGTALTGHIVISSLHTSDSVSAIPRLIDMKVEPYLVASTVHTIIAQRLVRKICMHCNRSGCDKCSQTGFKGRIGIYEVLKVNTEIRDAISKSPSLNELRSLAIKSGMQTILEDGLEKVRAGLTSKEEILRVIHE
ncbi:MAG: type II/IV secretion system protein [Candidatus Taylorbacteria bacterium]|nr:type II/IV secretion system protein [Candidatus Taylorbacteria bacterium]